MKSPKKIILLVTFFLLLAIPLTVFLALRQQEIRKKAAETAKLPTPPKPEYAPGEILVKFRAPLKLKTKANGTMINLDQQTAQINQVQTSSLPSSLQRINEKFKIKEIEKVFKGAGNPQAEVAAFKARFPQRASQVKPEAETIDLSKTYKLTFDKKVPVEQLIQELSQSPDIEYAEPNYIFRTQFVPNDPYYLDPNPPAQERNLPVNNGGWNPSYKDDSPLDYQWNLKKIKMEQAWDYAGDNEVVVAVVDTGVDYNHPELEGKIWTNEDEIPENNLDDDNNGYIDDWHGWDAVDYWWDSCGWGCWEHKKKDNDPMDDWREPYFPSNLAGGGHGTHVAGIISAKIDNNLGISGMNISSKIMILRGLTAEGWGYNDQLAELIYYATNNGAQIINMSWGSNSSAQTIADALEAAYSRNIVLVAAAGNDSRGVGFPALHPEVIAVSATNELDQLTLYSNFGPEIDVAAPGGEGKSGARRNPRSILSLRGERTDIYCLSETICRTGQVSQTEMIVGTDQKYYRASGTSMAAPHVAGLASLILSKNPSLTNEQVKVIVEYSADDLGEPGKDDKFGYGRINAELALKEFSTNPPPVALISDPYDQEHLYYGTFEVKGTASSEQFGSYRLEYAPLNNPQNWSSEGIELKTPDSAGIIDGVLGVWNSGNLEGKYYLRLTVIDKEGRERSDQIIIEFINQSLKSGWPKIFPNSSGRDPLIVDLDDDGVKEIVTTNGYSVFAYKENGELLRKWTITNAPRYIAAGELDPYVAGKEIVVGSGSLEVLYFINGVVLNVSGSGYFEGVLADVNNDGVDEILQTEVISSPREWKLHALKINGEEAAGFPVTFNHGYHDLPGGPSRLRVGDINNDGFEDVVINLLSQTRDQDNRVVAISGKGEVLWTKVLHTGYGSYTPPLVLVDLDLNGSKEVVFYDYYSLPQHPWYAYDFYVWRGDGGNFFSTNPLDLSEVGSGSLHVADIEGDDKPELLIISYEKFALIKNNGTISIKNISDLKVKPGGSGTVIGDLDSNNLKEFFTSGGVYMLPSGEWPQITNLMVSLLEYSSGNFVEKPGWPKSLIADVWAYGGNGSMQNPAIEDLDGDGQSEIILQYCLKRKDSCFLYVLEIEGQIGFLDWPQYLHDERHTGAYSLAVAPTPTSAPTPSPTLTLTPTPTETPVPTSTPTPSPSTTPIPTATPTPLPTNTPTPTFTLTPTPCPNTSCDVSGDGQETGEDYNLIVSCWRRDLSCCPRCDFNCDGVLNVADIQRFVYLCGHLVPTATPIPTKTPTPTPISCPRGELGNLDCSLDGCIYTADFELFRQDFGKSIEELDIPTGHHTPDLVVDENNRIDTADFEILRSYFGTCLPGFSVY